MSKWYLDCVDADGRSAIAYWSAVSWRGLHLATHNLALHEPDAEPRYWGSFSHVAEPELRDGSLTWRPDGLGWSVTGRTRQDSFGLRLLDSDDGSVDWRCQACPARLDVTFPGGTVLSGLGYAEHLTLGLAPWKLPIDELRWGRWIAATGDRSVVWIDWRGPHPMTAVFLDGARERSATVGDDGVAAGDAVLTLTGRRTLHHRALRDIVGRSETLARLLPGAWLEVQDLKWMSLGTLEVAGARPQNGWAIHEHVTFP